MSDTIAIAVRISDELERQKIVSMFEVMSPQLNNHWIVTTPHSASVVVLDADEPGSDYFLAACREMAGAVPILLGETNTLQAEWFLEKPVRAQALVTQLNHLGKYLLSRKTRNHQSAPRQDSNGISEYYKLRQMFEQLSAQPAYYRIDVSPTWSLYYDSVHDRVLLPHELADLGNPFNTIHRVVQCFQQRELTAITMERFRTINNDKRFALFNREALIWVWCLGHSGSEGTSTSSDALYQLEYWPNLTSLPHTVSHLKLCQYMITHLATPAEIADATQIPLTTVSSFCNACECLGLVSIKPASARAAAAVRSLSNGRHL